MLAERGMKVDSTYQLNVGGNTDFLNMLNRERLASKKISKTEAVQSQLDERWMIARSTSAPAITFPSSKTTKSVSFASSIGFGACP